MDSAWITASRASDACLSQKSEREAREFYPLTREAACCGRVKDAACVCFHDMRACI